MIISSVNNETVKSTAKLLQKKYRDSENKFILEGFKCVEEAILSNIEIETVFLEQNKIDWAKKFEHTLKDKIIYTTEHVLKKISSTESAPDIVAIAIKKEYSQSDFKNAKKLVLLENIKDLGNLGTIIRSCCAFNADGIILYGSENADIYNPKCIRSTVGNFWKIPFININNTAELKDKFGDFELIATLPKTNNYLKDFQIKGKTIVMFGSEADGLSKDLIDLSDRQVKIEMSNNVESLNLSVSCAIVLYKLFL